jgi:mediator complex subunit MED8
MFIAKPYKIRSLKIRLKLKAMAIKLAHLARSAANRLDSITKHCYIQVFALWTHVEEDYLLLASSEMATTLSQDQVKVLEQTRQRLVQLTHSLGSLSASLQQSDPLPPWYISCLFT